MVNHNWFFDQSQLKKYGVSKASISIRSKQLRKECQINNESKADHDDMKGNLQLKTA